METVDNIRNGIIDKLLTISNKDYLIALFQVLKNSTSEQDIVKLSDEQILMLNLSESDIKNGKLIPQNQLDKTDLEWLKGM
jgi:hypothetical protein